MYSNLFYLAVCYRANIARQLGVKNVSFPRIIYKEILKLNKVHLANSGIHFFLIMNLMRGIEKRSTNKFILKLAQWIASKHVTSVRNKAAKDSELMCVSELCAVALAPLKKAISLGDLPSRALMAWLLIHGREGIAKNWKRAFELVEEGMRLDCHHSKGVMAFFYLMGHGNRYDVAHKLQRSLELARESSGLGSRYGQYTLAKLHRSNVMGLVQDYAQVVAFYRLAVQQGLDAAQLELGYMYRMGKSVVKDDAEAKWLYQLAADQGYPEALYEVAYCHENGYGVTVVDEAEAIHWYRLAQAAGNTKATYRLRMLCE